ncbi:MAG TPA: helix-turn-helix domain-containing protein [Candidatus Limnocylindrales bacterium]
MDVFRIGSAVRAIRIKRHWRQADLAAKANVPRSAVSKIERGRGRELRLDVVLRIVEALGGRLVLQVQWQGGDLDRLLNARHSAFHESVAPAFVELPGWVLAPEVSFSIRGERGVIDILAWHAASRTLLVIELKTEIVDVNELMGTVGRKRRLAMEIGRERGWNAVRVALWVVVAESKTNRRRVANHAMTLRAALPADGRSIAGWLREPDRPVACLSFWSDAHGAHTKSDLATVKRVRLPRQTAA